MSDEKIRIQAYVIKYFVHGQIVTVLGADTKPPRDVIRRLKDQCKRYTEESARAETDKRLPFVWHELLLEGDGEGDGVVWVPNPLQVLEVSTPIDFTPEPADDIDDDIDEDEDEDEAPKPTKFKAKGLLQQ